MKRKFKDFNMEMITRPDRGDLYAVYMAKTVLIATYRDEKTAQELCDNLNIDPWYSDKKDRVQYKSARTSYAPTQMKGY